MKTRIIAFIGLALLSLFGQKIKARTYDIGLAKKMFDTIPKEIPYMNNGKLAYYYQRKGNIEKKLDLPTIEEGFDSLQIRLWLNYAFKDSAQLIVFKNNGNNKWSGELYLFVYVWEPDGRTIKAITKSEVNQKPKSGWPNFIRKINQLQITKLPDESKIKSYPDVADGDLLVIEVATKEYYRIYSYREPGEAQLTIKEAKTIEKILTLIEKEFRFKRLRKL